MSGAFFKCTNLIVAPETPLNAINLNSTFQGCISLLSAPSIIPDKVENMQNTFQDCTALKNTSIEIPVSVKNLRCAFAN